MRGKIRGWTEPLRRRLLATSALSVALMAGLPDLAMAEGADGTTSLPAVTVDAPLRRARPVPPTIQKPTRRPVAAAVRRQPTRASAAATPVRAAPVAARPQERQTVGTTSTIGAPPPTFAGGQVARGGRLGLLGNRDYMSTPFVQNSYTEKLIKDQQARTVTDVLENDPTVRATVSPYSYQDNYYIRGVGFNARDFAFDGLYGITGNRRPDLTGIERVEVLHGPGAFLFGFPPAGSVAGVINLVPKRAGDVPITDVSVDYLSSSNVGGTFDIGRRYGNLGEFGVRLNGAYRDGTVPIDGQTEKHAALTAALDYRADRARAMVNLGYTDLYYKAPSENFNVDPGFAIPKAPDLSRNLFQPWEYTASRQVYATARVEYDLAPSWTLFAAAGASTIKETFLSSLPTITDSAGSLDMITLNAGGRENQRTAEGGLRGAFDTAFIHHAVALSANAYWLSYPYAGTVGYSFKSNLYQPASVAPPPPGALVRSPYDPSPATNYGVSFADTMTLFDGKLDLIGGVREQWVDQTTYSSVSPELNTSYRKDALTPLGAVVVRPIKEVSVYANYAEGFSMGPTAPDTAANAGQAFPPTVSKQLEAGVKFDLERIGASAAVFEITQPSSFTDPVTRIFGVTGRQVNDGVEFNLYGSPLEGVRTFGGVQYVDGVQKHTEGGTYDGFQAPGVPHFQASFAGEYDIPFVRGLTATGRVIYTSRQYYDLANTQTIPAWTRLDLGARYSFNVKSTPVTARLSVENVTGNDYWQSTGGGNMSVGIPRTVKLDVTARF